MKSQKGFMQLPILITIVATAIIFSAGTFVVVKHGPNLELGQANISSSEPQNEIIDQEKGENKEHDRVAEEEEAEMADLEVGVNQTQAEIERLKKEQEQAKTEAEKARKEAERIRAEQELQKRLEEQRLAEERFRKEAKAGLEVLSVKTMPTKDRLRIEWKTNKPSESKIFIWPANESPGYTSFTSPSRSSEHYVDIDYGKLPFSTALTSGDDAGFVMYKYRIESNNDNLFAEKRGDFSLEHGVKSVNIEPGPLALKVEWETNIATRSKIIVWPIVDSSRAVSFTSPSRSQKHSISLEYGSLALYPRGHGDVESLLEYDYGIEVASGLFVVQRGPFRISDKPTVEWMEHIFELNPGKSCSDFSFSEIQRLACRNYVRTYDL